MAKLSINNVTLRIPIRNPADNSLKSLIKKKIKEKKNKIKTPLNIVGGELDKVDETNYVTALRNIDLKLFNGYKLGIIGHNGSGKTTLLKLMAGVYQPTFGECISEGDIYTIFTSSIGMDMDLNGLENIKLRCIMHGKNSEQIKEIEKDVIDFCEFGEFINFPLRTYSSGMLIRLSFALSTAFNSEILLIDENLDAGDITFKNKSQLRVAKFLKSTGILVIVSHSMDTIQKFCTKCLLLEKGRVIFSGNTKSVIQKYKNRYK